MATMKDIAAARGRKAAELLLHAVEDVNSDRTYVFPVSMTERASVRTLA